MNWADTARVDAQDGRIRFGVRREPIEVEATRCLVDPLVEGLELVTLEWDRSGVLVVLDEHAMFLDVSDAERLPQERRDEVVYANTTAVSGGQASGTEDPKRIKKGAGQDYTVTLHVRDTDGATTSEETVIRT